MSTTPNKEELPPADNKKTGCFEVVLHGASVDPAVMNMIERHGCSEVIYMLLENSKSQQFPNITLDTLDHRFFRLYVFRYIRS